MAQAGGILASRDLVRPRDPGHAVHGDRRGEVQKAGDARRPADHRGRAAAQGQDLQVKGEVRGDGKVVSSAESSPGSPIAARSRSGAPRRIAALAVCAAAGCSGKKRSRPEQGAAPVVMVDPDPGAGGGPTADEKEPNEAADQATPLRARHDRARHARRRGGRRRVPARGRRHRRAEGRAVGDRRGRPRRSRSRTRRAAVIARSVGGRRRPGRACPTSGSCRDTC